MSDSKAKMHRNRFPLGLRPRPCWGAHSAPSNLLPGFKGVLLLQRGKERGGRAGKEEKGEGEGKENKSEGREGRIRKKSKRRGKRRERKRKRKGEKKGQEWDWPRAPQSFNPALYNCVY